MATFLLREFTRAAEVIYRGPIPSGILVRTKLILSKTNYELQLESRDRRQLVFHNSLRKVCIMSITKKPVLFSLLIFLAGIIVGFFGRFWRAPDEPANRFADTQVVTLYDLDGLSFSQFTSSDFQQAAHQSIDLDLFRRVASSAKWSKNLPVWKGTLLVRVEYENGPDELLAVSLLGTSFKIVGKPGYWIIDEAHRSAWNSAIYEIINNEFIPSRLPKNQH